MNNGQQIREVESDDLDICFEIEKNCYEPSEAATKDKIEKRIALYPEGFLVAERDKKVVGFINSAATDNVDLKNEEFKAMVGHNAEGDNVVILSVAVDQKFRKKGIAGELLNEFISRMKSARKKEIYLICKENLLAFYEKFQFKNLGLSQSNHGGFEWYEMVLTL